MSIKILTEYSSHIGLLEKANESYWIARIVEFKGLTENPTAELIEAILKPNKIGIRTINASIKSLLKMNWFYTKRINPEDIIRTIYQPTISFQENKSTIFTVLLASLSFSLSMFMLLNGYNKLLSEEQKVICCVLLFLILFLFGLFLTIKPTITTTYDLSKFNAEVAFDNYVKRIARSINIDSTTIILYVIKIIPKQNKEKLEKLIIDLPHLYRRMKRILNDRFILALEIKKDDLQKIDKKYLTDDYNTDS